MYLIPAYRIILKVGCRRQIIFYQLVAIGRFSVSGWLLQADNPVNGWLLQANGPVIPVQIYYILLLLLLQNPPRIHR